MKKSKLIISIFFVFNLFLISKINSQNVNNFTGSFSYSVPLLSVPSPYGPPVSIGAGYSAGIGVNQNSSEIGLGWGINAGGMITRNVSGIPDDWDGKTVADPSLGGYKTQGGVLFFRNGTSRNNMDFYKSTYKLDTSAFYFPNYDSYSVSSPGISGSLQPHLFDFATTELNVENSGLTPPPPAIPYSLMASQPFSATMKFSFGGDYGGNLKSRHYPVTPISGSTSLKLPGDKIGDAESGYSPDSTPYVGVGNIGFNPSTNRLATARYVDYTYDSSNGITGFTITDESGFVYHFGQAVKVNSAIFGKYPLNNDYSVRTPDTTRATADGYGNYYINENSLDQTNNPYMVEWKQNAAYNYNWLLTAITGPDYIDSDVNDTVNKGDKGYWVIYDWQKWTGNFTRRTPEYGFDYSYQGDENEKSQDEDTASATKVQGKFATFSKYNQELYYLNKIQTASHTAIFVRDVRLDNYSSESYNYDNQSPTTFNMPNGVTKTTNYGTLYDDGGPLSNYTNSKNLTTTISPTGATSITIRFNSFAMYAGTADIVNILDGSGSILATYSNSNLPPTNGATFNYSTIKVQEITDASNNAGGFRLSWTSSVHTTVIPQLKLTRIVLFTNEDFATLNLPSSSSNYYISTAVGAFDVTSSGIGKDKFFNETWYNHVNNKTSIESKSLQTIEFNQDYSLAKKYLNNIKTLVCATDKLSPSCDVVKGTYVPASDTSSSGKLTLNEITSYSVGHVKTAPSVIFDYNKSIANDNPYYSPVKIDYWGFYKSDATEKGYSSYTTTVSKDYTDAWSLRKITSPMGGTIELNYESNQYEKVFDGAGGLRGPSKIYAIKSVSVPSPAPPYYAGENWYYTMEEGGATVSDFDDLKTSPPIGTTKSVFVPFIESGADIKFISQGTFFFRSSPTRMDSISTMFLCTPVSGNFYYPSSHSDIGNSANLRYTGNGYVHFQLPVGTAVYGGGIRVKSIVAKNGDPNSYTQEYTYSGGVAPMEAERFAEEKQISSAGFAHNAKLRPVANDRHRMGPGIGYTNVIIKNKGQNNIANGSSSYTFITSDVGIDNFKASRQTRITNNADHFESGIGNCTSSGLIDTAYIIEVIDKFSGFWGQISEMQTADINDNIISKTKNEYSNLTQGSIVENYDFLFKRKFSNCIGLSCVTCGEYHHNECILRNYPVVLTKQTVYSQGTSSVTEYLSFDPVTRTPTMIRNTMPNKGISVMSKGPAFRNSQYSVMGPKSVTSSNANILGPAAFQKATVDSTITNKSDFASYSVQTFKKDFNVRMYSLGWKKYVDSAQTNKYWISDKDYTWVGDSTSIDNYGLFKQSNFVAFDYTLASINKKWRLGTENTLLDNSGHVLELRAYNDRFTAKKYGYGDTMQIAEASNVNFSSFTYSGFESGVNDLDPGAGVANYIDGEIKMNSAVKLAGTIPIPAHTGTYLLKVPSGTTGSSSPTYSVKYNSSNQNAGLLKGRTYRASVWVHSSSPGACQLSASFAGGGAVSIAKSSASNVTIGNWILMNLDITVSATPTNGDELKVYLESSSGDAYFDDLRVHPVDATMSATVYEPKTNRVVATLDANNFATIYKYDAGGQILELWQEIEGVGLKRMKKYQHNFARGL